MSWLSKIKNELIIKTGDGQEYKPQWMNASVAVEYNVAEFEFPDIEGTLVHRTTPKGGRYNLELYFQGEDNLDLSEAFRESAKDPRFWILSHPFYGRIQGHPTGLNFDNSVYNITKISGTFVETITEDSPRTSVDPKDRIAADKIATDDAFAVAFESTVIPDTSDIIAMQSNNSSLYNLGKKMVKLTEDAEEYFNLFNKANAAILNATAYPLAAMRAMQAVINHPALFTDSVKNRLQTLVNQFNLLRESIETITSPSEKRIYENNAGSLVSSMALTSSTPQDTDYENRDDVYAVVEEILSIYNTYLEDLDGLQTENGGGLESYIPDSDSLMALSALINFTLSNLFNIALNSKQERSVILEDDSNVILLTHRFYGLDQEDTNVLKFMSTNSIGLNEILLIKKGRTIKYYV